jgi:ATP-dependent DNA helicase DinG
VKDTDLNLDNAIARLGRLLPGYVYRDEQHQFMDSVTEALANPGVTLIEGGTGIGKSFGYVIPLLLAEKSFTIATATRALQQQLLDETMPIARDATQVGGSIGLRMGRDNYLCPRNLESLLSMPAQGMSQHDIDESQRIERWFKETRHGNLWFLNEPALAQSTLRKVTVQDGDCDGRMCIFFQQCPYFLSLQSHSQGVISNHHLLIAEADRTPDDQMARQTSILVIDEAHLLFDRIEDHVRQRLKPACFLELARLLSASFEALDRDDALIKRLSTQCGAMVDVAGEIRAMEQRLRHLAARDFERLQLNLERVEYFLEALMQALKSRVDRSRFLDQAYELVHELDDHTLIMQNRLQDYERTGDITTSASHPEDVWASFARICRPFEHILLVSGSLSLAGDFSFVRHALGLASARTVAIGSPFDFSNQTRAFCLSESSDPAQSCDPSAFIGAINPLLRKVKSLVLFTTHRALKSAEQLLAAEKDVDFLVYTGGDSNRFLKRVAVSEHVVVLATKVFWQGIDFRQAGIRCVAIDRLPFAPPTDESWPEETRETRFGGDFRDTLLPRCGLEMKQGFGRLIRHESDRGVFVIGDGRFLSMSYGEALRQWLPETQWVNSIEALIEFLEISEKKENPKSVGRSKQSEGDENRQTTPGAVDDF